MGLVVVARIPYVLIVAQGLAVQTVLGVEGYDGLGGFGSLGGDHDDTVGTAGAIKGVGGGILEDGHALDILRVDVVDVTAVRHAVNDIKGFLACRDGAETADADARGASRRAGRLDELHARHLACKRGSDGTHLGFGEFIGIDDLGRTREGFPGGGTECDHDGLLKLLGILTEDDIDRSPAVYRNGLF